LINLCYVADVNNVIQCVIGVAIMHFSRRDFLKISGTTYLVAAVGCKGEKTELPIKADIPKIEAIDRSKLDHPPCQGYLLVDIKKCQGCLTCMLSCSLAHEGQENLSYSRIQIKQNPFKKFPEDITMNLCRQCVEPLCVDECPEGALYIDAAHGNVRMVDQTLCVGCMLCLSACTQQDSLMIWNTEKQRAQKCDLCADTPYWNNKGGAAGKQLCVEACPVGAIKLAKYIPLQEGDSGYFINLRGVTWSKWGYSIE